MSADARVLAADVLGRVLSDGAYSQKALAAAFERSALDERDRAWVTRAVYAVLADLRAVDLALERLLSRGIEGTDVRLLNHLRVSVWELGRTPHTEPAPLVSAAVDAARRIGVRGAPGLTNAVLRSLLRDLDKVFNPPKRADAAALFGLRHGLPDWIASRLIERLGEADAEAAMGSFNASTPVGFRCRSVPLDLALDTLRAQGLDVEAHRYAPDAGVCRRGNLAATELHRSGAIVIQDPGAQLACAALPVALGSGPVLDATAGNGGKTSSLADRLGPARVLACDVNRSKLERLRHTPGLAEVGTAQWAIGSAPAPALVADAAPFAAVVLDAPCSALGTLGRHPEVRWNRGPEVVAELAAVQSTMLDALAPLVAPGGVLLYVVCTFTDEEARRVVEAARRRHPALRLDPPSASDADPRVDWASLVDDFGAVSLWPHTTETDGFTIVRLRREA